jgi:hypothetical protein
VPARPSVLVARPSTAAAVMRRLRFMAVTPYVVVMPRGAPPRTGHVTRA